MDAQAYVLLERQPLAATQDAWLDRMVAYYAGKVGAPCSIAVCMPWRLLGSALSLCVPHAWCRARRTRHEPGRQATRTLS